jgi:hypothetical protein
VEKYGRACYRWQYGPCVLHVLCLGLHIYTPRLCNIYCFSTATIVKPTRLSVTLYVHTAYCNWERLWSSWGISWSWGNSWTTSIWNKLIQSDGSTMIDGINACFGGRIKKGAIQ